MKDKRIVVLTGAGISAESGLGTFRDAGGIWTRYRLEDVATPEGFRRDPALVHAFYNARRRALLKALPNAAHHALARLEAACPGMTIVTQNVDDLHERAGSRRVLHMHGELLRARCEACGHRWRQTTDLSPETPCPACGAPATRPDVVWFGEVPFHLDRIEALLEGAGLFAAIGTSGTVQPAASLVVEAARRGARTVEINLEPSAVAHQFDELRTGPATREVPRWVDEVLGNG